MAESLGEQIRRVLQEAPFAMRQLAADAGLSYDVLRSWRSGRRRPSRSSALRLAAGLQQRGELLLRLSSELRETAESGPGGSARTTGGSGGPERPGSYAADGAREGAADGAAGGAPRSPSPGQERQPGWSSGLPSREGGGPGHGASTGPGSGESRWRNPGEEGRGHE